MKINLSTATIVSAFLLSHSAFGQGALTPPGAPAPAMKSLDQIEARAPIASAPYTITNPGSYYLTANLTVGSGDAITIATNGVTLDLNGFTIRSTASSPAGTAILLNAGPFIGRSDITIYNGHIRGGVTNNGSGVYNGSGFNSGIMYSASLPVNVQISRVSVAGCAQHGIFVGAGDSTVVESCTVRTMGGYGIVASTIKACSAVDCGSIGIYGEEVSDCRGESTSSGSGVYAFAARNSFGHSSSGTGIFAPVGGILVGCTGQGSSVGINAGFGCTVRDCTAINNTLAGISTSSGSTITGCTVQNNSGDGIQVGAECLVLNNTVSFNGTAGVAGHGGIHVTSHRNRIEGNHVTKNNYDGILIDTTATNNFILKNTSGYNLQFQYRINGATTDGLTGPNEFAPLQTLKNSTNSWANFQLQ